MRVECIEIYKNILSPNTRQDKEELDETKKISKSKKKTSKTRDERFESLYVRSKYSRYRIGEASTAPNP